VKIFIGEHQPQYSNVEIKYIPGADPEMVFLTEQDEEVARVDVADMSTEKIVKLLASYNIHKKPPGVEDTYEDMSEDEIEDEEHESLLRPEDHDDEEDLEDLKDDETLFRHNDEL